MKSNPKELPWALIIAKLSGEISPTDNEKLEIWLADESLSLIIEPFHGWSIHM